MLMMIRPAATVTTMWRGSFRIGRVGLSHPPPAPRSLFVGSASFFSTVRVSDSTMSKNNVVVAMVAGGASGLGAAAAKAMLRRGARVIVADLNQATFENDPDFAKYMNNDQPQVLAFVQADVTNPDQVSGALDVAEAKFGRTINASVCCAGIATARRTIGKTGSAHSLEEFAKVLKVNTIGTFNVARLSAERMVKGTAATEPDDTSDESNGCIILTSSIAAYEGQVGQVAYAASKAAVVGMALPLARDLAPHKIRVVTIVRYMHSFDCARAYEYIVSLVLN
jgi:3-hydroxyacyl-CoA dehydrogenase / 3-hydroxy-2-methylbutyryl-CoA dehydrogenase